MNRLLILFLLVAIGCAAPESNPATVSEKSVAAPRELDLPNVPVPDRVWNVALLVMEGTFNSELTAPMDIFHHTKFRGDNHMNVFTVAETTAPITTFEQLVITPDFSYRDSLPPIDVLVVPSAEHHLDSDLENEEMIAWVAKTGADAQYVMSLCDGAFVLAKAGLLNGHECTTFPGDIGAFRSMFPELTVHEDVLFVHDGRMITSAGGAKSFEPALYLHELLYGREAAEKTAKGMVIDWNVNEVSCVIVPPKS